jgi:hypothetical protein
MFEPFFLIEVTTERLDRISDLSNHGKLRPAGRRGGSAKARSAHEYWPLLPRAPRKDVTEIASA